MLIQSFRKGASSWLIKFFLALIGVSMISFYGFRDSSSLQRGVMASIDGQDILAQDVKARTQNLLDYYRNMGLFKTEIPDFLIENMQSRVLDGLITQTLEFKEAKQMGFVSSNEQIRQNIQEEFKSLGQDFSFEQYKRVLEMRVGKTPTQYEQEKSKEIIANEFKKTFIFATALSDLESKINYEGVNDKTVLQYIKFQSKTLSDLTEPKNIKSSDLQVFYEKNKTKYKEPEKRKLLIASAMLEAHLEKPSESELSKILKAQFSGNNRTKGLGQRFHASHILIRSDDKTDKIKAKAKASQLHQRILKGESFTKLADQFNMDSAGKSHGDLGYFGEGDMTKNFEAALLTLKPADTSKPIETEFGFHIIMLHDKIDKGELTVSRLKNELTYIWKNSQLRDTKIKTTLLAKAKQELESSLGNNDASKVISTDALKPTDPIDSLYFRHDGMTLMQASKSLQVGQSSGLIESAQNPVVYMIKVKEIIPGHDLTLEQAKASVRSDFVIEKSKEQLALLANQSLQDLKDKKTNLDQLTKKYNLKIETTEPFLRNNDQSLGALGSNEAMVKDAFLKNTDDFIDHVVENNTDKYIVQIKQRILPNWENHGTEKEKLKTTLTETQALGIYESWIEHQKSKAKITRHNNS